MATQRKMIVTTAQNRVIMDHLDADDMSIPHEDFVNQITEKSGAEKWIVEKLVENWRYWHPNGTKNGLRDAQEDAKRTDESIYVGQPLPRPKTPKNGSALPENGTGKVAEILKHASDGKSVAEIIKLGYNKSTVYRQVSEWKKRNKKTSESKRVEVA